MRGYLRNAALSLEWGSCRKTEKGRADTMRTISNVKGKRKKRIGWRDEPEV